MNYICFSAPSYPYFVFSGDAIYRPGDMHSYRKNGIDFFDMILVETGTLHMFVKKEYFAIRKNDLLIIPAGWEHRGAKICTEKTVFHWLHFFTHEENAIKQEAQLQDTQPTGPNASLECGHNIFSIPEFQTIEENNMPALLNKMKQLETQNINYFIRSNKQHTSNINPISKQILFLEILNMVSLVAESSPNKNIAFSAFQYISMHYDEKITLDSICSIVHCHPSHLIQCLKHEYNITPNKLLIKKRLAKACNLLQCTTLPITQISCVVGFDSPAYFSKQFRSEYGCTPRQYRFREHHRITAFENV